MQKKQIFIMKHTVGISGVGKWMKRWKKGTTTIAHDVDSLRTHHMFFYAKGNRQIMSGTKFYIPYNNRQWMTSTQTDPEISEPFLMAFCYWRNSIPHQQQ